MELKVHYKHQKSTVNACWVAIKDNKSPVISLYCVLGNVDLSRDELLILNN